jgi:hypothetical protein
MPAVPMQFKTGPRTYVPAELIIGGQVIEARANGRVGVAGAGSLKTLGIAVTDGINPEARVTATTTGADGRPVLNAAPLPNIVTTADSGISVPCTYANAAAFGDRLKAAANGQVTPLVTNDDPRMTVGICDEPLGVAQGAIGLTRTK